MVRLNQNLIDHLRVNCPAKYRHGVSEKLQLGDYACRCDQVSERTWAQLGFETDSAGLVNGSYMQVCHSVAAVDGDLSHLHFGGQPAPDPWDFDWAHHFMDYHAFVNTVLYAIRLH